MPAVSSDQAMASLAKESEGIETKIGLKRIVLWLGLLIWGQCLCKVI